jgi:HAD superfamily hydrolase (TIGR01509 family)
MYKALLFDFFDVIHRDPQNAWLQNHGKTREGVFAEASDLLDLGEITIDEYFERYAGAIGQTVEECRAEYKSYEQLDDALVAFIKEQRKTYRTGLISNAHSDELRPIIERYDLAELFDEICISSEVGMAKPNPDIFTHVAGLLDVSPADCVFTDDNERNVQAARSVGMQAIVYTDFEGYRSQLQELQP